MNARAALVGVLIAFASPALATDDPYDALKAIDGHWISTTANGRHETIDNSCARTGLFFACEQSIGGKPTALTVFRPRGHEEKGQVFDVEVIDSAGDRAGPPRRLRIEEDHWYFESPDKAHGHGQRERTVESFSGPDFIHVETQASTDDEHWSVLYSESLRRAP